MTAKELPWEAIFVRKMKALRESCSMTQTDLAKELKDRGFPFHQQTIQRIEQGERPVRLNEAFAIADVFRVSLWHMVALEPPSGDVVDAIVRAVAAERKLARVREALGAEVVE